MAPRFKTGAGAYAKDGRRYVVDEVADGVVYCSSAGGGETEFPESQLLNETEWAARSGGRRDMLYARVKQAKAYAPYKGKLDRASSQQLLAKAEKVLPGILDFTAFTVASRVMEESGNGEFVSQLSIVKCREIFDAASPEARATAVAGLIGAQPDVLVAAGRLGDNLIRAMLDKGLENRAASFEEFAGRRRQ